MSILTQGTQVYVLAPSDTTPGLMEVLEIDCPTAFEPGSDSTDNIDITCLSETKAHQQRSGLDSPGSASLTVNSDPSVASHVKLYNLSIARPRPVLKFAVGWSDGTDIPPTLNSVGDDFQLPPTRTWYVFEGEITSFPFSFATNSVVSSAVSILRSGQAHWIPKV